MKPKDLKRPFSWDRRQIILQDRVFYVPDYLDNYKAFPFPGWKDPEVFGNGQPVHIEYCSGNGSWIVDKARAHPEVNWVAVELRFDRVRKIWSKLKNLHLNNLFVICGEGHRVTASYIPDASVANVYINFPDPWPKNRHAKHRIVKMEFVAELSRILQPGGILTIVTDDPDYSRIVTETLAEHTGFECLHGELGYAAVLEGYGTSFFEELWRGKGLKIHYHQYKKLSGCDEN